jgi:anti-sigma B factor antagonist
VSDGAVSLVTAPEELDAATAPELRNQVTFLLVLRVSGITIDLSPTTFVDSSGIGTLVALAKRAMEAGVDLRISGCRPNVQETFRINGLHRVLPIVD